jgi:Arc/MetJ-type ribon-helix-helix transcriptional regulator
MTITLTPEQMQWIEEAVAAGQFPSVEDAVRVAVADLKMSLDLETSIGRSLTSTKRAKI